MNNQAPSFAERLAFQADRNPGHITKPRQKHASRPPVVHSALSVWRGASNVSRAFR